MGPGRSSSLRISGDSSAVPSSGRTRGASYRSALVELRNAPGALPLPLDKGKGRVNLIEYPRGVRIPQIHCPACYNCGAQQGRSFIWDYLC